MLLYTGTFIVFLSYNRFAAAHASGHICIYTRTDTTTAANIITDIKQISDELKQYMIKDDIDTSDNSSRLTDATTDESTAVDTPELQLEVLNVSHAVSGLQNCSSAHISVVYFGQSDNMNHLVIDVVHTCCIFYAMQAAPSQDYMIPVELESASKVIAVMITIVNTTVTAKMNKDTLASIAQPCLYVQSHQKYAVHHLMHRTSVR
jgi:uncharacterized membrane protein YwzB